MSPGPRLFLGHLTIRRWAMSHRRAVWRNAALVLAATVLGAWNARAEDKPASGIAVGGNTPPFQVQDVTGPAKGSQLCYV